MWWVGRGVDGSIGEEACCWTVVFAGAGYFVLVQFSNSAMEGVTKWDAVRLKTSEDVRQRKTRELVKEMCDELAKEIGEDKAEVEALKREFNETPGGIRRRKEDVTGDDIFVVFEDVNFGESNEREIEQCGPYSLAIHFSKIHTVSREVNVINKDGVRRHSIAYVDYNIDIEDNESGWETVSHLKDQGSSCSPEGSAPSNRNHRDSNVSISGIEWEDNGYDGVNDCLDHCEEVKRAVFSIPNDSSPGPYGFGSEFYMSCWDIVKEDVMDEATVFFSGYPLSRLTDVVEKFASQEQGAFIPGHGIFENITLAEKMVHSLHKKKTGGNVMVKLVMAKAYDRVNWSFLLEVFKAFDDILIFTNGGKRSIKYLVNALETYEKWSGQKISKAKSTLFPSKYISLAREYGLLRITSYIEGKFPVTYLGAPLVSRKLTSRIMEPLVEKIRKKIVGWKYKLLSQGGRLVLLRHALSSMPMHLMSVINVLLVTIPRINSLFANFLWGDVEGFYRAKYCRNEHILVRKRRPNDSLIFRSMVAIIPEVMDNVKILVQGGNSSFWFDMWLASGPLSMCTEDISNNKMCIKDCWMNNNWNSDLLRDLVGADRTMEILHNVPAGEVASEVWHRASVVLGIPFHRVSLLAENTSSLRKLKMPDFSIMKEFRIQQQRVYVRPGKIISWAKPPAGWIKLNSDGSCKGNPVLTKPLKNVSSISRLWRSGPTNGENYKIISVEDMKGRLSNERLSTVSLMSPDRGGKGNLNPLDLVGQ
ncbi:hypothetical protein Ddye_027493 [Dipteronia dyeriana]|uniref:Reverse transcriptase domain-containing protein n=1 Tax=Dipteronia dyeriana TaxID=168575 RepID=A0AAD9TQ10_9ROSI|nr:hypothetical protein Ddye_027493 [Dipteronia dyeriana]